MLIYEGNINKNKSIGLVSDLNCYDGLKDKFTRHNSLLRPNITTEIVSTKVLSIKGDTIISSICIYH